MAEHNIWADAWVYMDDNERQRGYRARYMEAEELIGMHRKAIEELRAGLEALQHLCKHPNKYRFADKYGGWHGEKCPDCGWSHIEMH